MMPVMPLKIKESHCNPTGLIGSCRFFSDALDDSTLRGIRLGLLVGISPASVRLPFAVLSALGVPY